MNTGSVTKRPYPKGRAAKKLTYPAQLLIFYLVMEKPGITLHEIQEELLDLLLIDIDVSNICRCLHQSGFTRQKIRISALQKDELLRQQYIKDVSIYNTEMLIFLDQTGADRRNALRRYGYSMRSKPIVSHELLVRGCHLSGLAFMSVKGLLDVQVVQGTTNGEIFYKFVEEHLLPHLQPFNGINPHSVVIMDNCSVHHMTEIIQMIEEVGSFVQFLPPYSPDFMPIELAFF